MHRHGLGETGHALLGERHNDAGGVDEPRSSRAIPTPALGSAGMLCRAQGYGGVIAVA
jgi:hypothetical protein